MSPASSYTLTIDKSAFIDNQASLGLGAGGAISISNPGQVTIRNSTFSGNIAAGGSALAIGATATGRPRVELIHVTVANNTNGISTQSIILFNGISVGIRNSIIADNIGNACSSSLSTGSETTASFIEGTSNCGTATLSGDPLLGALTGNYYPLLDTSRAIGAGNASYCAQLPTDQIGGTRQSSACDMGAIENSRSAPVADRYANADADPYADTHTGGHHR